jgi:uncharacterized protein (TIGR04255 family)
VNKVELKETHPTEWGKYLNENLLGIFKLADDAKTIARAFHILDFNYGDSNLRFQYGMPNADYPAPIRRKSFVLDFDAYCTLVLSQEEIGTYLDRFHDKIKVAFEQVITDDLRKKLRSARG